MMKSIPIALRAFYVLLNVERIPTFRLSYVLTSKVLGKMRSTSSHLDNLRTIAVKGGGDYMG
jgi:hypothetical protein